MQASREGCTGGERKTGWEGGSTGFFPSLLLSITSRLCTHLSTRTRPVYQPQMSNMTTPVPARARILMLPGWAQSARTFRARISGLVDEIGNSAELVFCRPREPSQPVARLVRS